MTVRIAKSSSGYTALGSDGTVVVVQDPYEVTEIEKLIKERQEAGLRLTAALKKHGFLALSDDEPTETIGA